MKKVSILLFCLLILNCKNDTPSKELKDTKAAETSYLLELLPQEHTGIKFKNTVKETFQANYLNYEFIYNGSGVAVGDINNDGLPDIYFGGNSSDDKLYINQGNLKFQDMSSILGLENLKGWTTGINMVDINSDGLLDIYVCRSGPSKNPQERANKLFINRGKLTFEEASESYNLNKTTHSIHSAFFDYDQDGDLDMYLLNHPVPGFKPKNFTEHINQVKTGKIQTDFFFENRDGKFIDQTKEANLINFGYRHGIAVSDINNDSYPDLYISSDFDEPDFFYINDKNKSFTNVADQQLKHISMNSMGNEFADINNDGLLDIFVVDMAPSNHYKSKAFMKSMNTKKFNALSQYGFHYQYMLNTLQLNNGNDTYSEVAQLSGISTTDWSWSPLFFDMDLDGHKDLFITNGIKENFLYRDLNSDANKKQKELQRNLKLEELLSIVPSDITPNDIYKNEGNLKFKDASDNKWMSPNKFNSNGAAYADFDNDGDLDLVLNNMEAVAAVYKNNANSRTNNYIKLKLKGPTNNINAIGVKVYLETKNGLQVQEVQNAKGYLSSVAVSPVFGVGDLNTIDKVRIVWDANKTTELKNVKTNQTLSVNYSEASQKTANTNDTKLNFEALNPKTIGLTNRHKENAFNDYAKQLLLPQKQSTKGPTIAVADVNGDSLDDVFIGGAKGQAGELYIQNTNGSFSTKNNSVFKTDAAYEDNGSLFFDADGDKDLDLYITSGGYELTENNTLLQDRLYINNGTGNFVKSTAGLPKMLTSSKAVKSVDYDNDGDLDLVVCGSVIPGKYPLAPKSYILNNTAGKFKDVTQSIAPELSRIGMVSDIEIVDYNGDTKQDIILAGSWMPITILKNNNGLFKKEAIPEFEKTEGWYFSISSSDFDNDGDIDFVFGNIGANNKFHPSTEKPLHIFSKDFDNNGSYDIALSKKYKGQLVPVRGKECSSEQTPFLTEKIGTYKEFASLNMEGIYGNENMSDANHLTAYNFKSLYVENLGNGNFKLSNLPNEAQVSATQDFKIIDINNDGHQDIIGVGNLYDAEVETIRYDASKGYVLLGNSKGEFVPLKNSGFSIDKDMRAISNITIAGKPHVLVANNNDVLSLFKIQP